MKLKMFVFEKVLEMRNLDLVCVNFSFARERALIEGREKMYIDLKIIVFFFF